MEQSEVHEATCDGTAPKKRHRTKLLAGISDSVRATLVLAHLAQLPEVEQKRLIRIILLSRRLTRRLAARVKVPS